MKVEGFLCLCVGYDIVGECLCGCVGGWENFKARVRGFARELEGKRKCFCVDECMDGWQKLWVDAKVSRSISF